MIYHDPCVRKVTKWQGDNEGAAVQLGYGPVVIHAALKKDKEGGLFLSMPSRKGMGNDGSERYFDTAYFVDTALHQRFQEMAIAKYREVT